MTCRFRFFRRQHTSPELGVISIDEIVCGIVITAKSTSQKQLDAQLKLLNGLTPCKSKMSMIESGSCMSSHLCGFRGDVLESSSSEEEDMTKENAEWEARLMHEQERIATESPVTSESSAANIKPSHNLFVNEMRASFKTAFPTQSSK